MLPLSYPFLRESWNNSISMWKVHNVLLCKAQKAHPVCPMFLCFLRPQDLCDPAVDKELKDRKIDGWISTEEKQEIQHLLTYLFWNKTLIVGLHLQFLFCFSSLRHHISEVCVCEFMEIGMERISPTWSFLRQTSLWYYLESEGKRQTGVY